MPLCLLFFWLDFFVLSVWKISLWSSLYFLFIRFGYSLFVVIGKSYLLVALLVVFDSTVFDLRVWGSPIYLSPCLLFLTQLFLFWAYGEVLFTCRFWLNYFLFWAYGGILFTRWFACFSLHYSGVNNASLLVYCFCCRAFEFILLNKRRRFYDFLTKSPLIFARNWRYLRREAGEYIIKIKNLKFFQALLKAKSYLVLVLLRKYGRFFYVFKCYFHKK